MGRGMAREEGEGGGRKGEETEEKRGEEKRREEGRGEEKRRGDGIRKDGREEEKMEEEKRRRGRKSGIDEKGQRRGNRVWMVRELRKNENGKK